jgi:GNAT superfamily N-acetyltransferase
MLRIRAAERADLPRIWEVRLGVTENRLENRALATEDEVAWYMDQAIFLVAETEAGVVGFTCANDRIGYVWALFVDEAAQGRGVGGALLDAALARLADAGHRQVHLTTGAGTKAHGFYLRRGFRPTGTTFAGDEALIRALA